MSNIYGTGISTFAGPGGSIDCDPLGAVLDSEREALECCARILMSPPGTIPGSPNRGLDLMGQMGARVSLVRRERLKNDIEFELQKDERVKKAKVFEISLLGNRWRIRIGIALATGKFVLVLDVSDVTLKLLGFRRIGA